MGRSTKDNSLTSTIVVVGALASAWLAIELAFKPWLKKARTALSNSDTTHDPDDADGNKEEGSKKSPVNDDAAGDRENFGESDRQTDSRENTEAFPPQPQIRSVFASAPCIRRIYFLLGSISHSHSLR
ncbi:hypothetical protein F0562_002568 [Nyssa sinensis]|uniref:Outer envelope membrane protein 7 n=1 Tax=Nyssa sinensis TaxID=561372 RepID=A0A5J5C7S4_9ASTE|nr:hypothetical protein F0562_002568 [Nyssa sinensis]